MSKWKPIATAPKNGTHILVGYYYDYAPYGKKPDIEWVCDVALLMKVKGLVDGERDFQVHYARDGAMANNPSFYTHWAPLFEPPKFVPEEWD
jgi:hypothetical protein